MMPKTGTRYAAGFRAKQIRKCHPTCHALIFIFCHISQQLIRFSIIP
jgi:hypothetical protein